MEGKGEHWSEIYKRRKKRRKVRRKAPVEHKMSRAKQLAYHHDKSQHASANKRNVVCRRKYCARTGAGPSERTSPKPELSRLRAPLLCNQGGRERSGARETFEESIFMEKKVTLRNATQGCTPQKAAVLAPIGPILARTRRGIEQEWGARTFIIQSGEASK